jgi:hypothetical protein
LILIYADELGCQHYFRELTVPYGFTTSLEELKKFTGFKIAISNNRFDANGHYSNIIPIITELCNISNLVFVVETEFHYDIIEASSKFPKNLHVALPGYTTEFSPQFNNFFKPSWLTAVKKLYQHLPDVVSKFDPYVAKPKFFDALFGVNKPHRKFVYDRLVHHGLIDKNIVIFNPDYTVNNNNYRITDKNFIWEPGVEPSSDLYFTNAHVCYHGLTTTLSQIIPVEVYNNTAYTIVTETNTSNFFSFFTEKIAKPIVGRRLFVVVSGYKYLRNLRKIGFKTFDGIIDESYDLIVDPVERFTEAFEQIKRLCERDQQEVLDQIKPIVDHNYNLLMNHDLEKEWLEYLTQVIEKEYGNY